MISGLRRAQLEAEQTLGVFSQFIMCFLRDFQPEYAMATLLESLPYKQWIVGVGLDSDETDHEPAKLPQSLPAPPRGLPADYALRRRH